MNFKRIWAAALLTALVTSIQAADAKEEVIKAAKALTEKGNYSWRTTVEVPESSRFKPGPTDGKADKDGTSMITMRFGENETRAVIKGEKFAYTGPDGDWQSSADSEASEGPGRFMGGMFRNFKAPAAQVPEIVAAIKELKKDGDAYSGELTEEGAKSLMRFRGRAGGDGPEIKNSKGSAKFWVKDGLIAKYQYKVSGQMSFQGNDVDVDRTTTTEVKDVGTTKLEIPEAAKKKMS